MTFGSVAAKRTAHDGTDMAGSALRKSVSTDSGTFASVPPLTGSMTTTGL